MLIGWDGKVRFQPKASYGPSVHPHVDRIGVACWPRIEGGTLEELVKVSVLLGQPEVAVQYLISGFLEQVNVGDTYYRPTAWRKVEELTEKELENEPVFTSRSAIEPNPNLHSLLNPENVDTDDEDDDEDTDSSTGDSE